MQNQADIDRQLREMTETKTIPGVVAMAATGREVIYQSAFGKRDLAKDDSMTTDSVFWPATKGLPAGTLKAVVWGHAGLAKVWIWVPLSRRTHVSSGPLPGRCVCVCITRAARRGIAGVAFDRTEQAAAMAGRRAAGMQFDVRPFRVDVL